MMTRRFVASMCAGALALACGNEAGTQGGPADGGSGGAGGSGPGAPTQVTLTTPQSLTDELATVRLALDQVSSLDATGMSARYPTSHVTTLGYDPMTAAGLDKIQASSQALTAAELDLLGTNGFVISAARRFPTFTYGYATLYLEHLPLYVSADSILNAVHRSYDNILKETELALLVPELRTLLQDLRSNLAARVTLDPAVAVDVDFYLAVALSLLDDAAVAPVAGASAADIGTFVSAAKAATGETQVTLFGVDRSIDTSQFQPRGHYTGNPTLEAYFRAMMWLGRIDLRLIETQPDHTQLFYRRQFDAMLALHSLFDTDDTARHQGIDSAIEAFVGESDNMKVEDVPALLTALGAPTNAASVDLSDAHIAQVILDSGFGAQRISSDLMINGLNVGTLPLNRSFLLFGQRYTVDSHVFSNVVYDRVQGGAQMRMLPDPLDAAFAALGNDEAAVLLSPQLQQYSYFSDLASMRVLVDAHEAPFWESSLYNVWLSSLRALSPTNDLADPAAVGLPVVSGTEAWGRRILNTQLASWAELRHDTLLYAKQSYTGGNACEFPDAYVDPYPAAFTALARFADFGTARIVPIAARVPGSSLPAALTDYFGRLSTVTTTLAQMAEQERTGTPFTTDQMAFINEAVTVEPGCGSPFATGWYPRLVFGADPLEFDPTIADVHTQPYEPGGMPIGRILHVGTGYARLMTVTTNSCTGPRAYAGLASSYFERLTEQYDRLTDERWKTELEAAEPPDVPWMTNVIAR